MEMGKGWSLRLLGDGAKAGAFAYMETGKGWSLRLLDAMSEG